MKYRVCLKAVLAIAGLVALGACRQSHSTSAKVPVAQTSSSPVQRSADTNELRRLASIIEVQQQKKDPEKADKAMREFVTNWNPLGKFPTELKGFLRQPDEQSAQSVGYRFDGGYGGWMWTFQSSNHIITNVQRSGIN